MQMFSENRIEIIHSIINQEQLLTALYGMNKNMRKSVTPDKKTLTTRNKTPNKTHTNKSRSPSTSTIAINRSFSSQARCRGQKFGNQLEILEKELTNNTNKLCSCLQIYSILDGNMQSQRCLQHNNTLSLYCLNQRRILCVNCLYGMHKHRAHKVIPLKDCMEMVYEDNDKLSVLVEDEIKRLDYCSKLMHENQIILETEMHKAISEIDIEYKKQLEKLKSQYEQNKSQVLTNFEPLLKQCSNVKTKLDDFRYKVYEVYSKYEGSIPLEGLQQKQIMKQLLFVNILQLCQIRCRVVGKMQLQHLVRKGRNSTNSHRH